MQPIYAIETLQKHWRATLHAISWTGDHRRTPLRKTSGEDLLNNNGLPVPLAEGGLLLIAGGREVQQDVPLASTIARHSSQQTPPHSCQRTTGQAIMVQNVLRCLPEKRRESCARNSVLQHLFCNSGFINYMVVSQRPLPNIQTNTLIKLALEDTRAPVPPSSLAGLLWICCCCVTDGHSLPLLCPVPLAPSGVNSWLLQLLLSGPLWCCSHTLWFSPAWLLSGAPTPSGSVLPGSSLVLPCVPWPHSTLVLWSSSNTKSILFVDNSVHFQCGEKKVFSLL